MVALRIFGVAAKSRTGHLPNTGQTRYVTAKLLATMTRPPVAPNTVRSDGITLASWRSLRKNVRNIQYVSVFRNLPLKYFPFRTSSGHLRCLFPR